MVGKSFKITGDGAVHSFGYALAAFLGVTVNSNTQFQVKWLSIVSAGASALIGGSEVTSSAGFPVPSGFSQFLPSISETSTRYDLFQEFYYLAPGDVINCLYGVD